MTGRAEIPLLFAALTGRSGHGLASSASGQSAQARPPPTGTVAPVKYDPALDAR